MTEEQIERLVREANPVPDVTALEPVDVSLLLLEPQRRTEMSSNEKAPQPERRNSTLIGVAAAALLVIAGIVAIGLLNDPPVAAPATTIVTTTDAPATTTTVVTTTTAVPGPVDVELTAARSSGPFGTLTLSMPDGWQTIGWAVGNGAGFPQFISYWYVENVYGGRCDTPGELLDPVPGPTVDDLAAAFVEAWGPYATAPEDASLGGYTGKHMVLTVPTPSADCPSVNLNGWLEAGADPAAGASRTYPAPGLLEDIWILDVEGVRQVVASAYLETTTAADLAEQQGILDSMHIEPVAAP